MKTRILAFLSAVCLLFCGCTRAPEPTATGAKISSPARSLLVVPFDKSGAQAFLLFRFSENDNVAISIYPRDTVFLENADGTTLYAQFADGGAVGFSSVLSAFAESSIPVDRILSVRVDEPDMGLYALLAQTGNNLLFTNPPAFVYTEGDAENVATETALSATTLRRALTAPTMDDPLAYAAFRAQTARAVVVAVATAFRDEPDALFSLLSSVGRSTFIPVDRATFSDLFSPSPRVRLRPVCGEFAGTGTRTRFYPRAP